MDMISIVGIVLIVIAALCIKKIVGFMFKSLMFLVLLAGVYFFLGPYFGLPVPNFNSTSNRGGFFLLLLQRPHIRVMRICSQ